MSTTHPTRRHLLVGATAVTGLALVRPISAQATSPAHPAGTPGTAPVQVIALPGRDEPVPSSRIREIAVAFVAIGGDNEEAVFDKVVAAGINRVQIVASWSWIDRGGRDARDWSRLDRAVARARRRGLEVVVHINSTPDWVHPDLADPASALYVEDYGARIWYTPTRNAAELAAWREFTGALTQRYAGRVQAYEVWNEENWRDFMKPVEDAELYARMLREAYLAVKAADPRAQVIFGGTTRNDAGWLHDCYRALASFPGAARHRHFFDQMGTHPYADSNSPDNPAVPTRPNAAGTQMDDNFLGLDRVHAEMAAHGEADKPIYCGEFAYSLKDWFAVESDEQRAYYLRRAYELAAQRPWVSGLAWFMFNVEQADSMWDNWSLLQFPTNETAGYRELAELTGARRTPEPQALSVERVGGRYRVRMDMRGMSPAGVVQLYVDGVPTDAATDGVCWFTPAPTMAGRTVALQMVALPPGGCIASQLLLLPLGAQQVQVDRRSIPAHWSMRVEAGLTHPGRGRLEVRDSAGRVVASARVDTGRNNRPRRAEAIVRIDRPGHYTVHALDAAGRADARPTVVEVTA